MFGLVLAGLVAIWVRWDAFNPQMELRAEHGLIGAVLVLLVMTLFGALDWAPILLGASIQTGTSGLGRTVGLSAGFMGALAVAVSPLTDFMPLLIGVTVGLLVGTLVVKPEGRPRHG